MEKCSACGAPVADGRCRYCGATYATAAPAAGEPVVEAAVQSSQPQVVVNQTFAQPAQADDASPKNRWAAFVLCLFFGYFGIHYFYVGKIGMGVLYLLTLGLLGIGWVVDIVRLLLGSFRDASGRTLRA